MGEHAPKARRARQRCEASKPARDSVGLCGRPFDMELSDPAARGGAAAAPSAPADTEMCRSLLAALLRPAWPGKAAGWADALIGEFGSPPAPPPGGAGDPRARLRPEPAPLGRGGGGGDAPRRIAEAALVLGICLHDHIIISRSGWTSFRKLGLLETAPRAD